jgi:hypothetical protein
MIEMCVFGSAECSVSGEMYRVKRAHLTHLQWLDVCVSKNALSVSHEKGPEIKRFCCGYIISKTVFFFLEIAL